MCQRRISGAVTNSGTPLTASRTARPSLLLLVGAPPLLTTQTDGYPGTRTRKRPAAEHRAAARTGYAPPPPSGRSIATQMRSDPSRLAVASWAVSFAWRTTGDGSLAMVLLGGTYAAAATAAE